MLQKWSMNQAVWKKKKLTKFSQKQWMKNQKVLTLQYQYTVLICIKDRNIRHHCPLLIIILPFIAYNKWAFEKCMNLLRDNTLLEIFT